MAKYRDRDYSEGRSGRRYSDTRYDRDRYGRGSGSWEARDTEGWGGRPGDYESDRGYSGMSDFGGTSRQDRYFGGGESGPDYGGGYSSDRPDYDVGRGSYGSDYGRGSFGGGYRSGYGSSRFGSSYGGGRYRSGETGGRGDYERRSLLPGWSDYPSSEGGYRSEGSYGDRGERGWWDRTSDEIASWFGDEEAERRREMDERQYGEHRGRGPRNYTRSDERITEEINDRLTDNPFLDASDIDVSVNNGEVTLTGNVDSRYAKRRAEDIAENISGVKNVENRLRYNVDRSTYGTTTGTTSSTTTDTDTRSQAATGER